MRDVPIQTFPSYQDFICWEIMQSNAKNLFVAFLNDSQTAEHQLCK